MVYANNIIKNILFFFHFLCINKIFILLRNESGKNLFLSILQFQNIIIFEMLKIYKFYFAHKLHMVYLFFIFWDITSTISLDYIKMNIIHIFIILNIVIIINNLVKWQFFWRRRREEKKKRLVMHEILLSMLYGFFSVLLLLLFFVK